MRSALHYTVGWAAAALLATAQAATAPEPKTAQATVASCQLPAEKDDGHPFAGREESISQYEALPPQCLKAILVVCSEAARTQLLDMGSAATCSISYEALLRRGFGGNFQALMAWWRTQRNGSAITP